MKKVLGVLVVGVLALVVVLAWSRREADERARVAASTATAGAGAAMATTAMATATAPAAPDPPAATPGTSAVVASPSPALAAAASDDAACSHLSDLCSTSDETIDVARCKSQLADARKMSGEGNVARSEQCLADAKTCAAATGCISGGVGMGAMGEFLKGLGSALSH